MAGELTIDYEALAQGAMRGVIRSVLAQAARSGLPGDHHFYISFGTSGDGVVISKRLKARYPEEMMIVLQHRFWDLAVQEDRFEVKLTFDGIPERLVVPFAAIRTFYDPSVRYGLQFMSADFGPDASGHPQDAVGDRIPADDDGGAANGKADAGQGRTKRPRAPRKDRSPKVGTQPPDGTSPATAAEDSDAGHDAATPLPSRGTTPAARPTLVRDPVVRPVDKPAGGAQIVSLDKFRKK